MDMLNLTEEFIKLCSTILDRFSIESIDLFITEFHNRKKNS